MIYLLDTDLLIFLIRGLKTTASRAKSRQQAAILMAHCQKAQAAGNSVGLSAVTVSELEFGSQNSGMYETEIAAVRKVLAPFEVFAYDAIVSPEHYGRIRHTLESQGRTIGSMDLLIAAHVLALDATLVTNNDAHFRRVAGLRVLNWLKTA
ncbi:MAG: type II toxin-antitoxin system VapC family toxin [Planctomycetota bacterium]